MNTEKNEMENNDEAKFYEILKNASEKEKLYREMDKETLVNLLVLNDTFDQAFEPDGKEMKLWYYVSDWTGAKYLTNEMPRKNYCCGKLVYTTDGEVDIRVPVCMEALFPEIKYEDEPITVKISTAS